MIDELWLNYLHRHTHEGVRAMNRREFLKTAAIAGIGFSIPKSLNILADTCEAAAKSDLVIATGPEYCKDHAGSHRCLGRHEEIHL